MRHKQNYSLGMGWWVYASLLTLWYREIWPICHAKDCAIVKQYSDIETELDTVTTTFGKAIVRWRSQFIAV